MSERYLYSPWRIDYILAPSLRIVCYAVLSKRGGQGKLIVWRGKLGLRDAQPLSLQ
jgi:hypothetical protein